MNQRTKLKATARIECLHVRDGIVYQLLPLTPGGRIIAVSPSSASDLLIAAFNGETPFTLDWFGDDATSSYYRVMDDPLEAQWAIPVGDG